MRYFSIMLLILLGIFSGQSMAQTDDTTDSDAPASTVNYFFVACEDRAIFNLDGTMQAGFDLYIQVFGENDAGGTALSSQLRVPVDGDYQVSQTVAYPAGTTRLLGQFASAIVSIASESNPSNSIFDVTVNDTQDGCAEPAYGSVDTIDSGSTGTTTTADGTVILSSSGIFTPDGGVLNEVLARPQEPVVQIGARESEAPDFQPGRTNDPGLIFAECDAFAGADPGLIYDVDGVTVFWSWFAETPELIQDHLATARYEVFLNSPFAGRQPFPNVVVSPTVQREDGNYWVFYTANLGNGFKPGTYQVTYYVTWETAISDGFADFGPGTETPDIYNTCTFEVVDNPFGIAIDQRNPTVPLQQN